MDNPELTKKPGATKPTKMSPAAICFIVTIIAIVGAVLSLLTKSPLFIFVFMLPASIYEAIRTEEGASTKYSSIFMLIVLILEILLVLFNVNYDLAQLFETTEKYVAGYTLPLGDIKVVGPLLMIILSVVLLIRTYGPYTKWLSIVIGVGSLAAVFLISPTFFQQALKQIAEGIFNMIG